MPKDEHRNELHALRAELGGPLPASDSGPAELTAGSSPEDTTEIERALRELQRHLADVAEEAEEMVTEHPMASLAAAFCLGLIVGRISGAFK